MAYSRRLALLHLRRNPDPQPVNPVPYRQACGWPCSAHKLQLALLLCWFCEPSWAARPAAPEHRLQHPSLGGLHCSSEWSSPAAGWHTSSCPFTTENQLGREAYRILTFSSYSFKPSDGATGALARLPQPAPLHVRHPNGQCLS